MAIHRNSPEARGEVAKIAEAQRCCALRQPGDVYAIMEYGPANRVIAPTRMHG